MTDYTDLPQANALYQQREMVAQFIELIDAGGFISQLIVSPKPPEPGEMAPATMAISSVVPYESVTPEMMAGVRNWALQRQGDIDMELADLGISNPPERRV